MDRGADIVTSFSWMVSIWPESLRELYEERELRVETVTILSGTVTISGWLLVALWMLVSTDSVTVDKSSFNNKSRFFKQKFNIN